MRALDWKHAALALTLAVAPLAACGGSGGGNKQDMVVNNTDGSHTGDAGNTGDGGGNTGDASTGDMAGVEDFEDFVLGLINTQTSATTTPTPIADKTFTDSMDPAKFSSLF